MSEPAFPPHIAAALDRLTVPPLPHDFGERLIARIEAGDLPTDANVVSPPLPNPRRAFGSTGWRRSGRIVAVAAAFGLATATAAASGFFGEPVYVPVVSQALAKAKLVELPKAAQPKVDPPKAAANAPIAPADVETETTPAPVGRKAVHDLYNRLRADPEFRALPRQERLAVAKQEIQSMLEKGEVTLPELRRALAERRALQNPEVRRRIQRELMKREVEQRSANATRIAVDQRMGTEAAPQRRQLDPAKAEEIREAYRQLPPDQQSRVRELREQLRSAPPAERRAIRQQLRDIWQAHQNMTASATSDEKIAPENEGTDPVVR